MIFGDDCFHHMDHRFNRFDLYDPHKPKLPQQGCDILGISCIDSLDKAQYEIDFYINKTKKLLVYLSEPVDRELTNFLQNQNSDIHFFGDAVLNREIKNFKTVISWFVIPINYYASFAWAKNLISQLKYGDHSRPHKFDCLLGNQRPHRDLIFDYVCNSTYKDQFITTYYRDYSNSASKGIWDYPGSDLDQHNLHINNELINIYSVIPVHLYNQSYYSIIAETTEFNQHNQYTEKVAKPIIAKRPFIAFAGKNYLKNLRNLGFRTFNGVIDETYDQVEQSNLRYNMALDQVEFLLQQDPLEILNQLQDVLEHNQRHFLTTDWWKPIRQYLE